MWQRVRSWAVIALFAAVAAQRLYFCTLVPASTRDLPRHIFYGLQVGTDGLAAAGVPLEQLAPQLKAIAWSDRPYNYPVLALLFFTLVAQLSPTMFFAKLALTLLDALGATIVYRHTRQRLLALLYWAYPGAIWWVSREGQFEPLQGVLVIAAVHALRRNVTAAFALLALAIQAKVTAAAMLPLFVIELARRREARELARAAGAFALAFVPSLAAEASYGMSAQVLGSLGSQRYNPYYWNVFERELFAWNSAFMIGLNALASYGLVAVLAVVAPRVGPRAAAPFLAPIAVLIAYKLSPLCQAWYMLNVMPLLLAIEAPRLRTALFLCTPLLDVLALLQLFFGPLGFVAGDGYYDAWTAFSELPVPRP